MKKQSIIIFIAVIYLFNYPVFAAQKSDDILKAIIKINATIPANARTAGSLGTEREGHGMVIDDKGHILTIGYLILEAETIMISTRDGRTVEASFVAYDHSTGFGIVRAQAPLNVTPIELGQSSGIKIGTPILVAGHGGSQTVHGARIVSRQVFAGYWEYLLEDALFTSPPYASFSGAALLGPDGKLLGVGSLYTQVTVPNVGNVPSNMFVPIDLLKPILSELINKGRSSEPPKPWLGIYLQEIQGRVFVMSVARGGPAEKAGIQPNDIVLKINQMPVEGLADFYRKLWSLGKAGVEVKVSVLKNTRVQDVTLHSADRYNYLKIPKQKLGKSTI